MEDQNTKNRILFFTAIIIGIIGAIGQSSLLRHELVNTYPYKIMDAEFYTSIANFGIWFAPIAAVISGFFFGLKKFWLAAVTPVVFCPLLFSVVFKVFSILRNGIGGIEDLNWSFGGKTPEIAAQDFFLYSLILSFTGLIIGGVCSLILFLISSKEKLR